MKPLTWNDIIFNNKGLKEYRDENNITVPEEYINSVEKYMWYVYAVSFIRGAAVFMAFNLVAKLYMGS